MRKHAVARIRFELQLALHAPEGEKSSWRESAGFRYTWLTVGRGFTTLQLCPSPEQCGPGRSAIDEIVQVAAKVAVIVGAEKESTTVVDDVPVTEVDAWRTTQPALCEKHPPKKCHEEQEHAGPPHAPPARTAHIREADHVRSTTAQLSLAIPDGPVDFLGALDIIFVWTKKAGVHLGKQTVEPGKHHANAEQHEDRASADDEVLPSRGHRHPLPNGAFENLRPERVDHDVPDAGQDKRRTHEPDADVGGP